LRRFSRFRCAARRNLAGDFGEIRRGRRVIRPRMQGFTAMIRLPGATGFGGQSAPVASPRLIDVVAASLALSALSLCLVVTITVLSIGTTMPIPA
jgi:hypothetical protein